jgi:hypothetical protein
LKAEVWAGRIEAVLDVCNRPNPLAPIRVAGRWTVAVDAGRWLPLSIRLGQAARLCKRVVPRTLHEAKLMG